VYCIKTAVKFQGKVFEVLEPVITFFLEKFKNGLWEIILAMRAWELIYRPIELIWVMFIQKASSKIHIYFDGHFGSFLYINACSVKVKIIGPKKCYESVESSRQENQNLCLHD